MNRCYIASIRSCCGHAFSLCFFCMYLIRSTEIMPASLNSCLTACLVPGLSLAAGSVLEFASWMKDLEGVFHLSLGNAFLLTHVCSRTGCFSFHGRWSLEAANWTGRANVDLLDVFVPAGGQNCKIPWYSLVLCMKQLSHVLAHLITKYIFAGVVFQQKHVSGLSCSAISTVPKTQAVFPKVLTQPSSNTLLGHTAVVPPKLLYSNCSEPVGSTIKLGWYVCVCVLADASIFPGFERNWKVAGKTMQLTEMPGWHSESIQMSSQLCAVAALHCKVGRWEHMLKQAKCFTHIPAKSANTFLTFT